jgi:glycosyltransferase involved in cell wall biosynthesis
MVEILDKLMKVTIIIPTCSSERIPTLIKTVESIQAGTYKNIHPIIVADGNPRIEREAKEKLHSVSVISNRERKDWVFSINRVLKEWDSDYYIYASDDLIFPGGCIKYAMATMQERFPDGFGVVSIGKKGRAAFGLIGRKLVEHFPDRQVFCPDFIHYAGDSELMRTVSKLGIYAFPPQRESMVRHARMKDETWRLARSVKNRDHKIRQEREEKGYMWGVDFNLIVEKR